MKEEKKYFTTGQVAEHCGVNFRTVLRWINRGYIKANKLPGRGDHRITLDDFIEFLNANKFEVESVLKLKENSSEPKVLIIDDEQNIINTISRIFVNHGFKTISANNGFKAGYLLHQEKPQIVTLDLNMNSLNGFDVLKIIHGLNLKQKTLVVVISGDNEEVLKNSIDMGADIYLKKPFSKNDLEKIITKFFPVSNEEVENERGRVRRTG